MPKRNRSARRTKKGRAIPDRAPRDAFDHGTPEIQGRRQTALGASANLLPLSADNPVDILTARGFLSAEQNQAARDYQRVHAIVYGTSHAGAAALDAKRGGGLSVRARLVAQRQLDAWTNIALKFISKNRWSRYVIDGYRDSTIVAIAAGSEIVKGKAVLVSTAHESEPVTFDTALEWFSDLSSALWAISNAPRVHVSEEEVLRAECVEDLGEVDGAEYAAAKLLAREGASRMFEANKNSDIEFVMACAPRDRRAA